MDSKKYQNIVIKGSPSPEVLKVVFCLTEKKYKFEYTKFEGPFEFIFHQSLDESCDQSQENVFTSANAVVGLFCENQLCLEEKSLFEALNWEVTSLRSVVGSCMSHYHKKSGATLQLTDSVKACLMKINSELTRQGKSVLKQFSQVKYVWLAAIAPLFLVDSSQISKLQGVQKLCNFAGDFYKSINLNNLCNKCFSKTLCKGYFQTKTFNDLTVNFSAEVKEDIVNKETYPELDVEKVKKSFIETTKVKRKVQPEVVLPVKGEKNVLITAALPYCNNIPHLGNIIGCVLPADVYARYCRTRGWNTIYIGGTDEYGTATETKAIKENKTCQQICDEYHAKHKATYDWFNIKFDKFGRTTNEFQKGITQDIFKKLDENDCITEKATEQLKCRICDKFLADRFVEGTCPRPNCGYDDARGDQCDKCGDLMNAVELISPRCKVCKDLKRKDSEMNIGIETTNHLFIRLPKLEESLKEFLVKSTKNDGWSKNAKTTSAGFLQMGLQQRCITRDLKWGTEIPKKGYENKVFYVWFDAPIGYLSITNEYTDQWEKWWKNPEQVELYQFMAKDNVTFHAIMFPCTMIGCDDNYTMVSNLNSTEYLQYEDSKFSKSRGIGVFGNQAKETGIDAELYRYYMLAIRPETNDSKFYWEDFAAKVNNILNDTLGNFVNRPLKILNKSFDSTIPHDYDLQDIDCNVINKVNNALKEYLDDMSKCKIRDGLGKMMEIAGFGNKYIQDTKPWKFLKDDVEPDLRVKANTAVMIGANLTCLLAVLMEPFMPATSEKLCKILNVNFDEIGHLEEGTNFVQMLKPGHKINKCENLFRKIDSKEVEDLQDRFSEKFTPEQIEKMQNDINNQGTIVSDLKSKLGDAWKNDKNCRKEIEVLKELKQKLDKVTKKKKDKLEKGDSKQQGKKNTKNQGKGKNQKKK